MNRAHINHFNTHTYTQTGKFFIIIYFTYIWLSIYFALKLIISSCARSNMQPPLFLVYDEESAPGVVYVDNISTVCGVWYLCIVCSCSLTYAKDSNNWIKTNKSLLLRNLFMQVSFIHSPALFCYFIRASRFGLLASATWILCCNSKCHKEHHRKDMSFKITLWM